MGTLTTRWTSLFFLGLSALSLGQSYPAHADTPTQVVKVGVIQSLTGIAAEDGKTVVQALQLAAEDINSQGKQTVQLLIEDDGSQSKNAVTVLETLRAHGVDAVIGATWDFTTNAILPTAGRRRVVVFNTSTLMESLALAQTDGYGFSNSLSATDEAAPFATYLSTRKTNEMVVVFANNSWGETQLKAYRDIAGKFGVNVVEEMRATSYDANEWSTFVTRIKQKHADIVVLLLNKNDLEVFLRRANELGLGSAFFASKNLQDALRTTTSRNLFEGVCYTYPMEQLAHEGEFRAQYQKKYGDDARIYADSSYDALCIIAKAAAVAKDRNIPLKDALHDVQYDGLVGSYSFSAEKSFTTGKSSLVCVRNGEAVLER